MIIRQQELKIIQHNVLYWTKVRAIELCNLYNRLNPDLILLNSTSVVDNQPIKIFNYDVHTRNHLNEAHSGVAIAIRKSIPYRILDDYGDDLLGVQIETTKGPISVFTLYSPPRRNYLPIGDIRRIFQRNMPVYMAADLNAHHQIMGYQYVNNKGRIIKELIDRDIIKYMGPDFPTLVGKQTKPDVILANRQAFFNVSINPGTLTTSDHLPINITISTKPIIKEQKTRFNFKRANWEKYQELISDNTTMTNLNNQTKDKIDEEMESWLSNITAAASEAIPVTGLKYLIHPHNSDFLKILVNMYNQLMSLNYWNRQQLYLIRGIQEQIKNENLRLYKETWSNKISKIQEIYNDPKIFWANVQTMMGGSTSTTPYITNSNGEKLYTDQDKEGEFQNIWRNIFRISDAENQEFDLNHERRVRNYININEFQIESYTRIDLDRLDPTNYLTRPVTATDIKIIINQFKNKAPGKSGINKIMLIKLSEIAINKLKDIINATISIGYFPIILKNGLIILIVKPGKDPKNPINYRPITLLELPAKILERIINNRFHRFCEENHIFHANQYGFRRGKGTDVALAKINELIAINQKWKHHCNVVCRDISKAFNKILHDGIKYKIIKLEALPQIIKKTLVSYISNRTAQIRVNNLIGNKFPLESGVPQGGILSPTLFIFYTGDLPGPGPNCKDVIFADDITQVVENFTNNRDELAEDTETEIKRINNYENK